MKKWVAQRNAFAREVARLATGKETLACGLPGLKARAPWNLAPKFDPCGAHGTPWADNYAPSKRKKGLPGDLFTKNTCKSKRSNI